MEKKPAKQPIEIIDFKRADPEALAKFDPDTKRCTMNCGPHAKDPRTDKERKFLCDDCITTTRKQQMKGDFFVMLTTQNGGYTPLMDADADDIAKFETKEYAERCAKLTPFGEHYGYEVFERGLGL